jgi:hypothetical protein
MYFRKTQNIQTSLFYALLGAYLVDFPLRTLY